MVEQCEATRNWGDDGRCKSYIIYDINANITDITIYQVGMSMGEIIGLQWLMSFSMTPENCRSLVPVRWLWSLVPVDSGFRDG